MLHARAVLTLALSAAFSSPSRAQDAGRAASEGGAGAVLLSGERVAGALAGVSDAGLLLAGHDEPLPAYEVQELQFAASSAVSAADFAKEAIVYFHGGEELAARVLDVEEGVARLRLGDDGAPEIRVPVNAIAAFRLREKHDGDDIFDEHLKKEPPEADTLYARRGATLIPATGTFRGIDAAYVRLERGGKPQRLARRLAYGMIFAPVASAQPETDPPAVFTLRGRGQIPAYLAGVDATSAAIRIRLPGAKDEQELAAGAVERIQFASDRIVFLSDLEPAQAVHVPVVGRSIPHAKDRSIAGGPLKLGGREYRRGLGVRSHSRIEYALGGAYARFAAVIGLDDSAGDSTAGRGSVTFIVHADGKELLRREVDSSTNPETISLPMDGVLKLVLEVDFGADRLDLGDHADWASARLTKP